MIKIYGSARSSAGRCYLLMEELGLTYEVVPLDMMEKREHKSPEYLRLNPNGKVPCLVDGDFVLWESLAINFYLAEKHRPSLLGESLSERALVRQWSVWGLAELQPPMVELIIQLMFTPEARRDAQMIARAREKIPPMLAILDRALEGKSYLVGDTFTLADLNVASMVNITNSIQMPIDDFRNVTGWMERLNARPAFKRYAELRRSR